MSATREGRVEIPTEDPPFELNGPSQFTAETEFQPDSINVIDHLRQQDPLFAKVVDLLTVLREIGGVVSIVPVKEQHGKSEFQLKGFAWKWDSYAPPVKPETNGSDPEAQTGD